MVQVNEDGFTRAIQKDIHFEMEVRGVENFFEFAGEIMCIDPNTVRFLMKNGSWTKAHFDSILKNTRAVNLRMQFRLLSEQ